MPMKSKQLYIVVIGFEPNKPHQSIRSNLLSNPLAPFFLSARNTKW